MSDFSHMSDDELLAMYQQLKGGKAKGALPATVQKLDSDDLNVIGTASQMNSRLNPYVNDLESRKLDLGPVRNIFMQGQNALGMSSPQSREFATFRSDLEKMRNDSLRLNKGVQTEGDAQRAWNELFSNLNDEKLVAQRLRQIQSYNEQAIRFHQANVNQRRAQYGVAPPNYGELMAKPAQAGGTRMRTYNPKTGAIE